MTIRVRTARRVAAAVAIAALTVVSACGSDTDTSGDAGTTTDSASDGGSAAEVVQTAPVAVAGTPLAPFADVDPDPAIGAATPVVVGQSFDGSEISIGGPSDGPALYVFLAHWCPHCNDEIPELNELRDAGSLPADLDVVGISTVAVSDRPNYPPSEWLVEKDWTWPALADSDDSEALTAFGGTGFPYLVLVDAQGQVLARQSGASLASEIQSWVDAALA